MGGAIARGYAAAVSGAGKEIRVLDKDLEKAKNLAEALDGSVANGYADMVSDADLILLAVKPNCMSGVLKEVKPFLSKKSIVVSIAAGISIAYLETALESDVKIVRIMPNTPALVGEGMSALCRNANVTDEDFEKVKTLFQSVGRAEEIEESLIDSVIGVSGSSPAYVYLFIEALADGAVAEGMNRAKAYEFAAQAVLGSAKMVLETGLHPGALKDAVCSPGGTTIESVHALEEDGFRAAVIRAVRVAAEKSREMED